MNAVVDDLQDAVARAVATALRNVGYAVDSDGDESDSTRCIVNINSIGTGSWSEGGCKGYVEP